MTKPYVILSTTPDTDYLFLLPIVAKSWQLRGYKTYTWVTGVNNHHVDKIMPINKYMVIDRLVFDTIENEFNPALYSQVIRLYMPFFLPDDATFVTSDADMLMASDFIKNNYKGSVTTYGRDLTDYHFPMCYIMSDVWAWRQVMGDGDMMADLELHTNYKKNKHGAWTADQELVTKKLLSYHGNVHKVDRGVDKMTGLPYGRCDRYNNFKIPSGPIHDVHLMRDPLNHIDKLIALCTLCYPKVDWGWIRGYAEEFKKSL